MLLNELTPGPLFLTPGLVIALHCYGVEISRERKSELIRYLFNKLRPEMGWGLYGCVPTQLTPGTRQRRPPCSARS